MKQIIAITGATGFIGKSLLQELLREGDYQIRVLTRSQQSSSHEERFGHGVEVFTGDLNDPNSLKKFLVPGCTVVHLAYLRNEGATMNLTCTANLLAACKSAKIARLVHCSTADLVGRTESELINEMTPCTPIGEYGTTKLKIEHEVVEAAKNNFDAVILRPTAVLGAEGEQLKKLVTDIISGNHWKNYLRSCLFGQRRMNLVPVANVVGALTFLIRYKESFAGEIFIISSDDDPKNNFTDVEQFLMDALGVDAYMLPRFPVPSWVLKMLLKMKGRNNINPRSVYDSGKLCKLGFKNPVSLSEGLAEYAAWHRTSQHSVKKPSAT